MPSDPDPDPDRYDVWYARKLWELLPALYRASDSDTESKGPLEELVARIGAQAAVVRRSIDRLWEDQSIESCDDWVIGYVGELLATNLVAGLDARGQRLDVARTIKYRRRKGTVALLEELATDITGWSARVVEFFHRLGRTRHGLDPALGEIAKPDVTRGALQRAQGLVGARTRTGAGGLADLRDAHGAALAGTAFDEYFHTADVRRGRGATGWHDIPRLGVFVWRLRSFALSHVTPVADTRCTAGYRQLTFDPTGRDVPLFAGADREYGDEWISPQPHQVPGPISAPLLTAAFPALYPTAIGLYRWAPDYPLVPIDEINRDPRLPDARPWIDPARGRMIWPTLPPAELRVDYRYGFASEIGAGPYPRPEIIDERPPLTSAVIADPSTAITAAATASVVLAGSLTYHPSAAGVTVDRVELRAQDQQRPLIRVPRSPLPAGQIGWVFTGSGAAPTLTLDGIFLSGGDLVLRGDLDRVVLSCCTLDPGTWRTDLGAWATSADERPLGATRLFIQGRVRELIVDRCITGPIRAHHHGRIARLAIRDSIVQAAASTAHAIVMGDGEATLERTTLLGPARFHRLDASECILDNVVRVLDHQHGCVRFSAFATGSRLPRQYQCVPVRPHAGLFAARGFGDPTYAQLLDTAGAAIAEGAEDGSEMGAFWRERAAIKERGLLIKYQEYLPLGLEPVVVHAT
jgi:hypothetical protein